MTEYLLYVIFGLLALIPLKMIYDYIYDITHMNPLNGEQIEELAGYVRKEKINQHYNFLTKKKKTSRKFSKNMNPDGKYYHMEVPLEEMPSVAASLLKSKRYEWRILAFERDGMVDCIYSNKGEEHSVSIKEDISKILQLCDECEYTTVFDVHNHPSGELRPSSADISSCNALSSIFMKMDINFIGIIVSDNLWTCYYKKISDNFLPKEDFINEIYNKNGTDKEVNLELHKSLRKYRKRYRHR